VAAAGANKMISVAFVPLYILRNIPVGVKEVVFERLLNLTLPFCFGRIRST
jgi:hypothetical protein